MVKAHKFPKPIQSSLHPAERLWGKAMRRDSGTFPLSISCLSPFLPFSLLGNHFLTAYEADGGSHPNSCSRALPRGPVVHTAALLEYPHPFLTSRLDEVPMSCPAIQSPPQLDPGPLSHRNAPQEPSQPWMPAYKSPLLTLLPLLWCTPSQAWTLLHTAEPGCLSQAGPFWGHSPVRKHRPKSRPTFPLAELSTNPHD